MTNANTGSTLSFLHIVTAAANTNAVEGGPKLSVREYEALCDGVSYGCDSLSSCLDREVYNERTMLVRRMKELESAILARKNERASSYRESVLRRARTLLDQRHG